MKTAAQPGHRRYGSESSLLRSPTFEAPIVFPTVPQFDHLESDGPSTSGWRQTRGPRDSAISTSSSFAVEETRGILKNNHHQHSSRQYYHTRSHSATFKSTYLKTNSSAETPHSQRRVRWSEPATPSLNQVSDSFCWRCSHCNNVSVVAPKDVENTGAAQQRPRDQPETDQFVGRSAVAPASPSVPTTAARTRVPESFSTLGKAENALQTLFLVALVSMIFFLLATTAATSLFRVIRRGFRKCWQACSLQSLGHLLWTCLPSAPHNHVDDGRRQRPRQSQTKFDWPSLCSSLVIAMLFGWLETAGVFARALAQRSSRRER